MNRDRLRLSAQRALLFNIFPKIRSVSLCVDNNILCSLFYVKDNVNKDELDMIYAAVGEICGDFKELIDSKVGVILSDKNIDELETLDIIIFSLCE